MRRLISITQVSLDGACGGRTGLRRSERLLRVGGLGDVLFDEAGGCMIGETIAGEQRKTWMAGQARP